ncbi:MAG: hypothetical protein JJE52_03270 [Acidimicrobiia bacterium]|nr:hypothetical protein [Acidimicrobiia bacterium]
MIAAVDIARDWAADRATSMSAWVVAMCRVTAEHAAEWVRVGRALEELPALRAVYATGLISWDQLRPATLSPPRHRPAAPPRYAPTSNNASSGPTANRRGRGPRSATEHRSASPTAGTTDRGRPARRAPRSPGAPPRPRARGARGTSPRSRTAHRPAPRPCTDTRGRPRRGSGSGGCHRACRGGSPIAFGRWRPDTHT